MPRSNGYPRRGKPSSNGHATPLEREREVPPAQLRWSCDPAELPFETTEQVEPLRGTIGQERAADALAFGLEMEPVGFNIFVAGPVGTGRHNTTSAFVEQTAQARPMPSDWCYVHNFADPSCPLAIELPAGQGKQFGRAMDELVEGIRREIGRAFESPQYRQRRDAIRRTTDQRRDLLIQQQVEAARSQGFALSATPVGVVAVPLVEGRPMTPEEFGRLPDDQQRLRREQGDRLVSAMAEVLDQVRALEHEAHAQMAEIDRQVGLYVVGPLIRERQAAYRDHAKIVDYLRQVQDDVVAHIADFRRQAEEGESGRQKAQERAESVDELVRTGQEQTFERYRVNVLVDNGNQAGAPIVFESNPTYYNLLGRIEYRVRLGTAVTDFHLIKPGALHRANGGYLVLQAQDVLTNPFAWDALKRALRTGEVRVENLGEQFTAVPTATLRPEPIRLATKVVVIGPPALYYQLYFYDDDFRKLFKVKADFDVEMARTPEHLAQYAGFVARQIRDKHLRHFRREAIARIAEHGARIAEHQDRLTTRFNQIVELAAEASHWAGKASSPYVLAEHVDRAIAQKIYRSSLVKDRIQQLIAEGTIFIDTAGSRLGQVNGLSILDVGDHNFGRPVRVTAQTALGSEGVLNVEREARLSGPIHNKGFLILTSFLTSRYAQDKPLALAARITFEQTYDEIEGDSASSTELYALLSSLADLPLRQDVAVTGSVNQHGEIQPIGGVTQKIEGFFEVCKAKGLSGRQGVLIPEANVKHLMLKAEIIEAVRAERFHVWAVRTIDDGIELLTGVPAGGRRSDGSWEPRSVNDRIDRRLRDYAERVRSFGRGVERTEPAERHPAPVGPRTPRVQGRAPRRFRRQ